MNTPTTSPIPNTSDTPDTPDTPDTHEAADTTTDGTLADEVFVDDDRTAAIPTTTATAVAPTPAPVVTTAPEPQWIKGPAPFALVLGLLGLVVAGSTLLAELADVTVPWNDLGPWSVVAAGIVVLVVGAIGLRSSRART